MPKWLVELQHAFAIARIRTVLGGRSAWLARLSTSFFIFAIVLLYEADRGMRGVIFLSRGRMILYFVGALLSIVLGMLGVRERHRRDR